MCLDGAGDLMKHAESRLGVKSGGSTADGLFTLEGAECQAACTEAPCLQVNYRHQYRVTPEQFDQLVEDLVAHTDIPEHGVLSQIRQHIPEDKFVGTTPPEDVVSAPVWLSEAGGPIMTEMAGTPIPHAPGFIANTTPRIVTSRFDYEDSYTLAR